MTETMLRGDDYRPSEATPGMSLRAPGAEGVFRLSVTVESFSAEKPKNGHAVLWIFDEQKWRGGTFVYVAFRQRKGGISVRAQCRLQGKPKMGEKIVETPVGLPVKLQVLVAITAQHGGSICVGVGSEGGVAQEHAWIDLESGVLPTPQGDITAYLAGTGDHEPLNSGMVFHRLTHEALAEEPAPEPEPVDPSTWTPDLNHGLYRFAAVSARWLEHGGTTPDVTAFLAGWLARGVFRDEPEHGDGDAFRDSWRAGWREADMAREIDLRERER